MEDERSLEKATSKTGAILKLEEFLIHDSTSLSRLKSNRRPSLEFYNENIGRQEIENVAKFRIVSINIFFALKAGA